jgi:glutamine amidotransferase
MVAIVDYGVGNLFSLVSSFRAIGVDAVATRDKKVIESAERIVLPGVGAFGDAIKKLKESSLAEVVISQAKKGKPILGICLGMQLLFNKSYEYGVHDGLGLIDGEICPIKDVIPSEYKIPHIGWNALKFKGEKSPIFKYLSDGDFVYFVHSYYGANCDKSVTATAEYGASLTASVQDKNVFGCQFHPEKSGEVGLKILKAFCEV